MRISGLRLLLALGILVCTAMLGLACSEPAPAPAGPSAAEVEAIVSKAVAAFAPESVSASEIQGIVDAAITAASEGDVTEDEIAEIVAMEVKKASAGQPDPLTAADVDKIVKAAIDAIPTPEPVMIPTPAMPAPAPTETPTAVPTPTAAPKLAGTPTIPDMVKGVTPAVVQIIRGRSSGTGFIVDKDGLVVTNDHVVSGFEVVLVRPYDGRTLQADVLGVDEIADLAVIKSGGRKNSRLLLWGTPTLSNLANKSSQWDFPWATKH